jgi:hypothetical protein
MLRRHMLASTGAEVCIIGLAIMAMIDFSPWSEGVLWCLTALCRALQTTRVSAGLRDRYYQVLYLACPPGRFRYPEICRVVRAKEARIDIILTISIPGGLRVWRSLQRFARQYFGGHREKEERYHSMI